MRNIACVACLDPTRSVHTRTFLRAIEFFQQCLAGDATIRMYDDGADAAHAENVARTIVADQPDCVVGHFLSDAAYTAAPIYADANLTLLLPAATRTDLTNFATTFRVCDSEVDYVHWLIQQLNELNWRPRTLLPDETLHAQGLASELSKHLPMDIETGNCQIIIGRYEHCKLQIVMALEHQDDLPLTLLTDDAASEELCADLQALGVPLYQHQLLVAALRPVSVGPAAEKIEGLYQRKYHASPSCYFWETIAALQLATLTELPLHDTVDTVLGPVCFNTQRELALGQFSLLQCEADGFVTRVVKPAKEVAVVTTEFRQLLSARRLMLRQRSSNEDNNYGREATARWVRGFTGEMSDGVNSQQLAEQVTEFIPANLGGNPDLFYLHGGGMVYYDVSAFAPFLSHIAVTLKCRVVAFDYDKLPEHSPENSINTLMSLIEIQLTQCRHAPKIAGDSVGGLLALYTACQKFPGAFTELILIYPVLALHQQYPSYQSYGKDYLLDEEKMRWFLSLFRPYFRNHNFNPMELSAKQLQNLPPVRLFSAGCDVLHDEAVAFYSLLKTQEKKIQYKDFPYLPHDFCLYRGKLACAELAVNHITNCLLTIGN